MLVFCNESLCSFYYEHFKLILKFGNTAACRINACYQYSQSCLRKRDKSETKEHWPFLWGEKEYVVNLAASYIFLVNAVEELLQEHSNN
jgi:hypothetical protein